MRGRRIQTALIVAIALSAAGAWPPPAAAQIGGTVRVSVDSREGQADVFPVTGDQGQGSYAPAVNGTGDVVAFFSNAADLVPGDTNGVGDVFVRQLDRGRTRRVSVGRGNRQANGISGTPDIDAEGRAVAFGSAANNLVRGDTNGMEDIFVRDLHRQTTERVSVGPDGGQLAGPSYEPAISQDGRWVAFVTAITGGPVRGYVHDRRTGTTILASIGPDGSEVPTNGTLNMSGDGRTVLFTAGVPLDMQLYLRDLRTGTTVLLAAAPNPLPGSLDADGSVVAYRLTFWSVVVLDRDTGARKVVLDAFDPVLSADGQRISFTDVADGEAPIPGDPNTVQSVYVLDLRTGELQRTGVDDAGRSSRGGVFFGDLSADGRVVAFEATADDLVPDDTNGVQDIILRRLAGADQDSL